MLHIYTRVGKLHTAIKCISIARKHLTYVDNICLTQKCVLLIPSHYSDIPKSKYDTCQDSMHFCLVKFTFLILEFT